MHARQRRREDINVDERVERPAPPDPALLAQLQRSAGNQAVTRLVQRHLLVGASEDKARRVELMKDLPDAARRTLDAQGPVAEAVLEHQVTSSTISQFIPEKFWTNPGFWAHYIGQIVQQLEVTTGFKADDKLYGVKEARAAIQTVLEKQGTKHPTIDTVNNALGVLGGNVQPTGKDTAADAYAAWLTGDAERELGPVDMSGDMWTNIKRSCKAAIVYTTSKKGADIHFELAGLNVKSVLEERKADKEDRRITGIELRSIYRSFFRQANALPEVASRKVDLTHVTFYLNGKKVDPPWTWPEGKEAWEEYGGELKTAGTNPTSS